MRNDFIDALSVAGFVIGLQNLELNIDQNDMDNQTEEINSQIQQALRDIHTHLRTQDDAIEELLRRTEAFR